MINVLSEVQAILGRKLTDSELKSYKDMRAFGYANSFDIVNQLKKG